MDPVTIKCYVCNNITDDWRSSLNGLKSKHSGTLISDSIKKILGNFKSMRNVDDETNCICEDCVIKIEEYDWTCMLAKRCESELYEILVQTETSCLNDEDETEMVGDTAGFDMKDGQSCDDMLLVEAFTPMVQLHCDIPTENEDVISVKKEKCDESWETVDETVDTEEFDSELDDQLGCNYSYDYEEGSVEEELGFDDDDFIPLRAKLEMTDNETTEEQSSDWPKTQVKRDPSERRGVGRPRTRPERDLSKRRGVGRPRTRPERDLSKRRGVGRPRTRPEKDPNEKRGVGRPRTRPVKDPSEKRGVGRPRTRPKIEPTEKRGVGRPSLHPGRKQENKMFECNECEKTFLKQAEFNLHKRWHREQTTPKFRCKQCFYISDDQETFDEHAKLHENVDPLKCVLCNVILSTKKTLTTHVRCHQEIQDYVCHLCGKQFVRSMSLKTHMKYHLNIRDRKCPHCPMTFVETKNLTRHLKTHSQIKPYCCSICGRRFAYSYNVRPHEKTHTDANVYRKFKCNFCNSAFDTKAKLSQHHQKSHSMITPHLENTNNLNEEVRPSRWVVKEVMQKSQDQSEDGMDSETEHIL